MTVVSVDPVLAAGGVAALPDVEDLGKLHNEAIAAGEPSYVDPASGYNVFTAAYLRGRGKCCGCACRHCPYHHENVALSKRQAGRISAPTILCGSFAALLASAHRSTSTDAAQEVGDGIDVLFWSGGKDSYLAARALCRDRQGSKSQLLLLTTFDAASRQVAHQEVNISEVCRQAQSLGVPLVGVPMFPYFSYNDRIADAFQYIADELTKVTQKLPLLSPSLKVDRVCNGDLHLESVRGWREVNIGPLAERILGARLHAPLWRVSYRELMDDLMASGTPIRVCAVNDAIVGADTYLVENQYGCGGGKDRGKKRSLLTSPPSPLVQVGEFFDRALLARLEEGSWDTFGENGEFHSLALVWECILPDALLGQATTAT